MCGDLWVSCAQKLSRHLLLCTRFRACIPVNEPKQVEIWIGELRDAFLGSGIVASAERWMLDIHDPVGDCEGFANSSTLHPQWILFCHLPVGQWWWWEGAPLAHRDAPLEPSCTMFVAEKIRCIHSFHHALKYCVSFLLDFVACLPTLKHNQN